MNHSALFSASELLVDTRKNTGITLIDEDVITPLTQFCNALNQPEAALNKEGVAGISNMLQRLLSNRLRMLRDFNKHPEIADQKVRVSLSIMGLPRSGTTKLHKLLASSGDFNYLSLWQALYPSLLSGDRTESPQERINKTNQWIEWNSARSPHFMTSHPFEAETADEEIFVFHHSLEHSSLYSFVEVPQYIEWLQQQDPANHLRNLKRTLQYLQWQGYACESKPWLLKSPAQLAAEPLFLKTFPNTKFIMPHRHPAKTMPSSMQMIQSFRAPFTHEKVNAKARIKGFSGLINKELAIRAQHPELEFLDLNYLNVVSDSHSVIEKVYRFANIPLLETAKHNMQQWEDSNPKGKHGKHKYSLQEFGLSQADIDTHFAKYTHELTNPQSPMYIGES